MDRVTRYFRKWSKLELSLLALIVLLTVIIHVSWIFSLGPLISGDWAYFDQSTISSWAWPFDRWIVFDGIGRQIVQGNFVGLYSLYGVLSALGVGFEIISRILYFLPAMILPAFLSYILLIRLTADRTASLVGALFYSFNSYVFIIHGGHLNISVAYGLAPLAFCYALLPQLRASRYKLVAVLTLMSLYEARMAMIVAVVAIVLRFLYSDAKSRRGRFTDGFVIVSLLLLVNVFWIVPRIFSSGSGFGGAGSTSPLNWMRLDDVVASHHPFWSTSGATDFVFNSPLLTSFLVPLVAFALLPLLLRSAYRRLAAIALVLLLIALFGLLQERSVLGGVYSALHNTLPFTHALRESSKLFVLSITSFAVLIALSLLFMHRQPHKSLLHRSSPIVIAVIVGSILVSASPFVLQRDALNKTYQVSRVNQEVAGYNEVIEASDGWFRTLWFTRRPKFAHATNYKPAIDALQLERQLSDAGVIQQRGLDYMFEPSFGAMLDMLSVRYVAIPQSDEDMQFTHFAYAETSQLRSRFRSAHPDLREISPGLFENSTYRDRLYVSNDVVALDHGLELFSGLDRSTSAYLFPGAAGVGDDIVDQEHVSLERFVFNPRDLQVVNNTIRANIDGLDADDVTVFRSDGARPAEAPQEITTLSDNIVLNGSFQNEATTFSASDCNNYDRTVPEANGITGAVKSDETVNDFAEISVRTHTACFSRKLALEQTDHADNLFVVTFRYKVSEHGRLELSLYPAQNEPLNRRTVVENDDQWRQFLTVLPVDQYSSDSLDVIFYLNSESAGRSATAAIDDVAVYYIDELPDLYARTRAQDNNGAVSVFQRSDTGSSSRHEFEISGLNQNALLVFGDSYSSDWEVRFEELASGNAIDVDTTHMSANGLMNGWLVNDVGDYSGGTIRVIVSYRPDVLTIPSLVVSLLTVAYILWRIRRPSAI